MLAAGKPAPSFSLPNQHGSMVSLSDYRGKWVVVYFYPKDHTYGCTKEACAFRDAYQDFTEAGAEVIGISSDSGSSHLRFSENNRLPFQLLSDIDGQVRSAFEVPKTLFFIQGRSTFVINPSGIVVLSFNSQLNIGAHVDKALKAIAQ